MSFLETQYKHGYLYTYEHYMYVHYIFMSTFKRLNRFDFEIHEVGYQECIDINGDVTSY
jgi:hypothetical protein